MAVRRLPFALCRPRYASCCTRICAFMQSQTVRPSTLVHPSARPSVRLSSPIIALAPFTGLLLPLLHFFVRSRSAAEYRFPGVTSRLQRYIGRPGILLSRLDIEILPNTIETPSTAMEITISEKGQILRGRDEKKKGRKKNCAAPFFAGSAQVKWIDARMAGGCKSVSIFFTKYETLLYAGETL